MWSITYMNVVRLSSISWPLMREDSNTMSDHALATVTITPRGVWLVLSRMGPPRGLLYWRSKFSPLYHGNTFSQPDQPNLPYTFPSTPQLPKVETPSSPSIRTSCYARNNNHAKTPEDFRLNREVTNILMLNGPNMVLKGANLAVSRGAVQAAVVP